MRRQLALLGLVAALAGCGGDDRREAYEAYVAAANEAHARFAPGFEDAQKALAAFAEGEAAAPTAKRLRRGVSTLRGAREALALAEPPREARTLHQRLLRLLDLQARLSLELALAADYVPRAERALREPGSSARTLRRALRTAERPQQQSTALRTYAESLTAALTRFGSLAPPPVLAPWHEAQEQRLRAARSLAVQLGAAIDARDRADVDDALAAYGRSLPDARALNRAQVEAVQAFNRRLEQQHRLHAAIVREELRIADTFSS
ncbi:MAG TPA: hypothetical protein VM290_06385 [Gaiellaceae bacterium]|nr:hypothetical protein [Gaiellaceae bacterium]